MKAEIKGHQFDMADQPFLGDLRELQKACGFGWGTAIKRLQAGIGMEALDLLDDQEKLDGILAWSWMMRKKFGERDLTWADAQQIAITDITFIRDPEPASDGDGPESGAAADPTEPTPEKNDEPDSAPVAG